jgi:hypothetical protein
MSILEAIAFLKGAVGHSLPGGQPSIYSFNDGVMYAQSPSVLAAYPTPHLLGTFAMAAEDIEALSRMPSEPEISAGDGTIIFKAGRKRSTIDLLDSAPPIGIPDNLSFDPPPPGLIDALRTALPFIPSDGTWNRSVLIHNNRVVALSNRSSIEVKFDGLADHPTATLSDDCVSYLCGLKEGPVGWHHTNNAVIFSWSSGAWARCQRTALPWQTPYDTPEFFENFAAKAQNPVSITDDFREEFAFVAALGDGTVTLTPEGMVGRSPHAEHAADMPTGAQRTSTWAIKALAPVIACASVWHPDTQDGPAYFSGPKLCGVVVGQRR